ncbi:uncharacterized protein LTR77_009476 [Saxophila tyrrhenica]|uniref:Uncharacterized protein n=1 Tax=Saxophila tyrrhenica TaxID=1690608 RepID=A0AAV9P1M4_9PEZI|nr:hypothetical protein LTR77_009476 [Saxophila tyrrhenica]
MLQAHGSYKRRGDNMAAARAALIAAWELKEKEFNLEDHVRRADLAVVWGDKSVETAQARLDFLKIYRNAFEFTGIDGHTEAGEAAINSGRAAVVKAKKDQEKIWRKHQLEYIGVAGY